MSHVVVKREFEELIDTWAAVGQIGTGFTFTEGPIWHPVDHYLLFSDMPADVRRRWDQRGGVREVKRPSNKCNGMTYDAGPEPDRVRACHLQPGARAPRRAARGACVALRGLRAQQPQRRRREVGRLDLFLRPLVRAHAGRMASSGRASSASRASIACRRAAARRSCWSSGTCSTSPTGCASRPTSTGSTSTTPCRR